MFTGGHSFQSAQEPPALRRAVRCRFPRRVFADGASYLTAFIGRNEIDGGVEGHARCAMRPVRDRIATCLQNSAGEFVKSEPNARVSRYQARPVDTYSRHKAAIRSRVGYPAFCKKGGPGRTDASLFTCVDWGSPPQPRTLGTGVKHGPEGFTWG